MWEILCRMYFCNTSNRKVLRHRKIRTRGNVSHTQQSHHSYFVVKIDSSNYCFMTSGPVELMLAACVSLLWTFVLTVNSFPHVSCASFFCRDPSIILTHSFISAFPGSLGIVRIVVADSEHVKVLADWFGPRCPFHIQSMGVEGL